MKTSVFAIIVLFLLGSVFISGTNAQGRMGKKHGMRMGMGQNFGGKFLTQLNLTDAQKDKINTLRDTHQKKMIDLRADLQKDQLTLKELRTRDNLTRDEVIAAVEKINKDKDAISLAMANHLYDVREILTPEQRKLIKDKFPGMMMKNHRSGHGMGTGMHRNWK